MVGGVEVNSDELKVFLEAVIDSLEPNGDLFLTGYASALEMILERVEK